MGTVVVDATETGFERNLARMFFISYEGGRRGVLVVFLCAAHTGGGAPFSQVHVALPALQRFSIMKIKSLCDM